MAQTKRRTAPEIIAFHVGWDIAEVSDHRYQPTRYANPAIYSLHDYYYAAPSTNTAPKRPAGKWKEIGEHYGRKVYSVHMNDLDLS